MKQRIGITGGIGSGKSRVARFWSRFAGIDLIDLDDLCRELLLPGKRGLVAMERHFGRQFIGGDGRLLRTKLREAIFSDRAVRREVDAILHPLAGEALEKSVAEKDSGQILIEIPLLFEAGWQDAVEKIVLVYADAATRCNRISRRDNVSLEAAEKAIAAQWPMADKVLFSDHVIDNSGAWPATCLQTIRLAGLLRPEKSNVVSRKSLT